MNIGALRVRMLFFVGGYYTITTKMRSLHNRTGNYVGACATNVGFQADSKVYIALGCVGSRVPGTLRLFLLLLLLLLLFHF